MPYASNGRIRIHYHVEGQGPPLVLHHGFSLSLEGYCYRGDGSWVEALKNDHRLILIDARGHGHSDKPHDPEAYRMALRVADVVAVLDDLGISKAHFQGYSMGGWVGFGIAKYAPERFCSLILGGAQPYQQDPGKPDPYVDLLSKGIEAFTTAVEERFGGRMPPERKAQLLANDVEALIASRSLRERHRFEDILPAIALPCLLYVGESDPSYAGAKKCSEIIPNATFVSLQGDHFSAGQLNKVLPHIRKFLSVVSQA